MFGATSQTLQPSGTPPGGSNGQGEYSLPSLRVFNAAVTLAPRHRLLAAASLVLLTTSGCCDLALYLCGPDRSRWVSVSYDTADDALATFLEAIRRDAVRVVYESLSEDLKERVGIPGGLEMEVVWDKLKKQMPGIHLLGTAHVLRRIELAPDRVRFLLERSGRRFTIDTRRSQFVEVRYAYDGDVRPWSAYVDDLSHHFVIEAHDVGPSVVLRMPVPDLPDAVEVGDLRSMTAGSTWRVDGFAASDDEQG